MLMGLLKWDLGSIEESRLHFTEARAELEGAGDLRARDFCVQCLELIDLYTAGKESRLAGLFYLSIGQFDKAWWIGRNLGIDDFLLKCLRQQALVYLDMGRLDLFLENSRKGLAIATRLNHRVEQARHENNIGVYYQQRFSLSQAAAHFDRALAALGQERDPGTEAECLNNLGLVYRELGSLDRARQYLLRALGLDRRHGNEIAVSVDLINIGSVHMRHGIENDNRESLLEAFKYLQDGLTLINGQRADPRIFFAALNNMGVVLNELRDREGARRLFRRALAMVPGEPYALERCQALNNLASSFRDDQEIDRALEQYRASLQIGAAHHFDSILMDGFFGLGQCAELRLDDLAALAAYRRSIGAFERLRGRTPSEPYSIGFARNRYRAYDRAIDLLARRQAEDASGPERAELFELIERAKARAFLEGVQESLADRPEADRLTLSERLRIISGNIERLSKRIAGHGLSRDDEAAHQSELELEEDEYIRLSAEMRSRGEDRETLWPASVRRLADIQRSLAEDDAALLEYHLGEPESCLLVVTATGSKLFRLPRKSRIEASLRAYLRFVSSRTLDPAAGFVPAERIGRELVPFDVLGGPFRARSLIVIPDGILHHLPFEALRTAAGSGSKYLVECLPVSYCPSASAFWLLKKAKDHEVWKKDLLAIGAPEYTPGDGGSTFAERSRPVRPQALLGRPDVELPSLPYSGREVRDIARLFPAARTDILSGRSASESRLKKMTLSDYRIIHFACHGTLDERFPYRSALVLALTDTAEDDGWLQTREIYGMSLHASLVVLSACQTAQGLLEKAEGPLSITRPFFFAGARSLVASLWQINDQATVHFMREFYRNLVLGRSKSDALRSAKLWMLGTSWNHPFYWAGFMLQGDPSAMTLGH